MTFDEYMRAVEDGNFPKEPRLPPQDDRFENQNGLITNMALGQFGGLALISSTPKSVRSNHYHKTDWHFLYVVVGSVRYYWRPVGSKDEPRMEIFRAGEAFFTPPLVEHAVYSPRSSEMLSLSKLSRRHANHEADVVRVPLIKLEGDDVVVCP